MSICIYTDTLDYCMFSAILYSRQRVLYKVDKFCIGLDCLSFVPTDNLYIPVYITHPARS